MSRIDTADAGRDLQIISIIGVVHLLSHAYQFALAPLFPVIGAPVEQGGLGVSFTELGLLASLFFASSGLLQTPAGFLVDRIGARPVLIGGLMILSLAVFAYSIAPNYAALVVLSIVAGAGNSVFHPADYSLINGSVSPPHLGRAYSVHSIGGYVGFALAPAVMPLIEPLLGWRGAVALAGAVGIVTALAMFLWKPEQKFEDGGAPSADDGKQSVSAGIRVLMQPTILLGFLFFLVLAMGLIGLKTMGPTALHDGWDLSIALSGNAIALFSVAGVIGIGVGGVWADKSAAHNRNAFASFLLGRPVCAGNPGVQYLCPSAVCGSGCSGILFRARLPNRDLFIRSLTPKGASGRVFGFVYGGLDLGASLTPVMFGYLMDLGEPAFVIYAAGILMFMAALVIRFTDYAAKRWPSSVAPPGSLKR